MAPHTLYCVLAGIVEFLKLPSFIVVYVAIRGIQKLYKNDKFLRLWSFAKVDIFVEFFFVYNGCYPSVQSRSDFDIFFVQFGYNPLLTPG